MIRIVVADDHELIHDGLQRLVARESEMRIVGAARSARELFALLETVAADVLVLDISLPDQDGLEVLRALRTLRPEIRTLVLSMHPEDRYARRALAAGACGYATKDSPSEELIEAIRRVYMRGVYVSSSLAEQWAHELGGRGSAADEPHTRLSNREYQLLLLIGEGMSTKAVAERLGLSINTVNSYRRRLLTKMGLHRTSELIRYVARHDLAE